MQLIDVDTIIKIKINLKKIISITMMRRRIIIKMEKKNELNIYD